MLIQVAVDVAAGMKYLHHERKPALVHRLGLNDYIHTPVHALATVYEPILCTAEHL